ncbi:MAG: ferredoxin family protein [Pirellulales bacterium]|nr:ferredoxin family protein [Pirellulales bacterium]
MSHRLSVVVSQSRSSNPKKRALEEQVVADLLGVPGVDLTVVAHLYDLAADGTGMLCMSGISGDLVVCSWLFPRAARWVLHRNNILGQEGTTLLRSLGESDEAEEPIEDEPKEESEDEGKARVLDQIGLPPRRIYCLDLRAYDDAAVYGDEIKRIAGELQTPTVELAQWIGGNPKPEQMQRYLESEERQVESGVPDPLPREPNASSPTVIDEEAARRWYPVIDLGRCTNCLECIDFCLFGVYGIDAQETILVEQPDNCRQGCPACSRVCPENAIIFPQHKTPTIAGSPEVAGNLKIDLSQLFGAPDPGTPGAASAVEVAARERDEQLLLAGRETVGMEVGIPKRHTVASDDSGPKDALDRLIDSLDELDL